MPPRACQETAERVACPHLRHSAHRRCRRLAERTRAERVAAARGHATCVASLVFNVVPQRVLLLARRNRFADVSFRSTRLTRIRTYSFLSSLLELYPSTYTHTHARAHTHIPVHRHRHDHPGSSGTSESSRALASCPNRDLPHSMLHCGRHRRATSSIGDLHCRRVGSASTWSRQTRASFTTLTGYATSPASVPGQAHACHICTGTGYTQTDPDHRRRARYPACVHGVRAMRRVCMVCVPCVVCARLCKLGVVRRTHLHCILTGVPESPN